jgi:hypothetical protein
MRFASCSQEALCAATGTSRRPAAANKNEKQKLNKILEIPGAAALLPLQPVVVDVKAMPKTSNLEKNL